MSGGSFKQHPKNSSGLLSFLDGTNGPPVTAASTSSPAYGLKLSTLQMSGRQLSGMSPAGVTLSAWELREMSGEATGITDDPNLGMKERLAIEKQQGLEFAKIHDGTHPAVCAYLAARTSALEHTAKGVKQLVTMFESNNQRLPPPSSSSPLRAASKVPASSMPEIGPDVGQNRRSDRQTGPGFHEHRKEEDSRLGMLTTSAKKAKTPLVMPVVENPQEGQSQATGALVPTKTPLVMPVVENPQEGQSQATGGALVRSPKEPVLAGQIRRSDRPSGPGFYEHRKDEDSRLDTLTNSAKKPKTLTAGPLVRSPVGGVGQKGPASPLEPISAEIPSGGGVLGVSAISMLSQNDPNDLEVGPIRRSDRPSGPGFYEHRKDEDSRLEKLTNSAKKPKTAQSPLAVGPVGPSSPAGGGVARYPVQAENDRVNQPKKRARP